MQVDRTGDKSLPVVFGIQPGERLLLGYAFQPICVGVVPLPPNVRAGRQRAGLSHFPSPFDIDSCVRRKLWKSLGDDCATGQAISAIFQDDRVDLRIAFDGSPELNAIWKIEDGLIVGYIRLMSSKYRLRRRKCQGNE